MKYKWFLIFALAAIFTSCKDKKNSTEENPVTSSVSAEDSIPDAKATNADKEHSNPLVLKAIEKVLEDVRKNDKIALAKDMAYRGLDEKRLYKESFDYNNRKDKFTIDATMKVMRDWLVKSTHYSFGDFKTLDGDTKWYVQEVIFHSKGSPVSRYFGFVVIGEEFKLGELTENSMVMNTI